MADAADVQPAGVVPVHLHRAVQDAAQATAEVGADTLGRILQQMEEVLREIDMVSLLAEREGEEILKVRNPSK